MKTDYCAYPPRIAAEAQAGFASGAVDVLNFFACHQDLVPFNNFHK